MYKSNLIFYLLSVTIIFCSSNAYAEKDNKMNGLAIGLFKDNYLISEYEYKSFQERLYGPPFYHHSTIEKVPDLKFETKVKIFSLSYSSWGKEHQGVQIYSDGLVVRGSDTKIFKKSDIIDLTKKMLRTGILSYHESTIQLKQNLASKLQKIEIKPDSISFSRPKNSGATVFDGMDIKLIINIPELNIHKIINAYEIENEIEGYPDIIEFKIFQKVHKELSNYGKST